mmetsp:Transcript_3658/g.5185  ORF Transcript_3658/g.5185 Transcript_3658/m.5185 type:complete len:155 (-) Transcript_3658:718-1182(-)
MSWRVRQVRKIFPLVVSSSYAAYQWSCPRTGYGLTGAVERSWFVPKVALCDAVEIYPGIKYEEGDDGGCKLVGAGLRRLLMVRPSVPMPPRCGLLINLQGLWMPLDARVLRSLVQDLRTRASSESSAGTNVCYRLVCERKYDEEEVLRLEGKIR